MEEKPNTKTSLANGDSSPAPKKVWVPRIRYEILGNLGVDRSLNTYTNHPPIGGSDEHAAR